MQNRRDQNAAERRSRRPDRRPDPDKMTEVYICAEGRGWKQTQSGGYERVARDAVTPGMKRKPKPFDEKNGF